MSDRRSRPRKPPSLRGGHSPTWQSPGTMSVTFQQHDTWKQEIATSHGFLAMTEVDDGWFFCFARAFVRAGREGHDPPLQVLSDFSAHILSQTSMEVWLWVCA